MPERIVLVGLGGIGSQLLPPLVRYLACRPEPRPLLVLVDGDAYEPGNRTRQIFPADAIGSNKAEALAEAYRGARHQVTQLPELTRSVDALLRELTIVEKTKAWAAE